MRVSRSGGDEKSLGPEHRDTIELRLFCTQIRHGQYNANFVGPVSSQSHPIIQGSALSYTAVRYATLVDVHCSHRRLFQLPTPTPTMIDASI